MKRSLVTLTLIAALTQPAIAAWARIVVPESPSDVQVQRCVAFQVKHQRNADGGFSDYLAMGVSFKNTGNQPVAAVRIRYTVKDTFGNVIGTGYQDHVGSFVPGVLVDKLVSHQTFPRPDGDIDTLECTADSIKYEDGSTWKAVPTASQ